MKIGDTFKSDRLGTVQVVRIHPFGTVDVRKVGTDSYYRITGLGCPVRVPA